MRCLSSSSSSEYKIDEILNFYEKENYVTKKFDDAIYVQNSQNNAEFFVFTFGCVVIWGADEQYEEQILSEVNQFSVDEIKDMESDFIYFTYCEDQVNVEGKTYIDEEKNKIILANDSKYIKLSLSYGFAQSVKLKILENSVSDILRSTAPINKELAKNGSISMSKKEISKQIGNLFSERYSINLHSDVLDTPEFFWRRPSYEPLYLMAIEFQDITLRHSILNHRLDIIQELYNVLSNELNYKHSTRLEITIIVLITIEVVLALLHEGIFSRIFSYFA